MITQERLKEVIYYSGGDLIRKVTLCNKAKKGDLVGTPNRDGYLKVFIDGKTYLNHRLVFLYHHGYLPEYLDHINGIRDDNRIENLRACTSSQNRMNSIVRRDSASKVKGVCLYKSIGKWSAYIKIDEKQVYLGLFSNKEDAEKTIRSERSKIHGEFANHG